jgi:glycogen debranching enzyme
MSKRKFHPILPVLSLGFSALTLILPASAQTESAPQLSFENRLIQGTLGTAYQGALDNLLRVNTVTDTNREHNKAGLMTTPDKFIKAGGGYSEPWTRDASINSWNAGSLLEPVVARNTLWAVCQKQDDGTVVLQRDNQWWDKVIWITAAWNHFKVTGDRAFLTTAYSVAQDELALMRKEHFSEKYGLFQGPSFFNDGIAGYPEPEYDPNNRSSFVLDHHYTKDLMALSTNCIYYSAYRCAAMMAQELGRPRDEAANFNRAADALKDATNKHLWNAGSGTYGYFIHGTGPLEGKRDDSQEGIGISYAILFGVADARQTAQILKNSRITPHGITDVWPHFSNIVWPLINGMWATAAANAGDLETFEDEVENLVLLSSGSDGHFYEIYHPITGKPDGGWQTGRNWPSQPDQTWSATAYLRMIYQGLFGLDFQTDGLRFAPHLPARWGSAQLKGIKYRGMTLDVSLQGAGNRVGQVSIDGEASKQAFISATLTGAHTVSITMKK